MSVGRGLFAPGRQVNEPSVFLSLARFRVPLTTLTVGLRLGSPTGFHARSMMSGLSRKVAARHLGVWSPSTLRMSRRHAGRLHSSQIAKKSRFGSNNCPRRTAVDASARGGGLVLSRRSGRGSPSVPPQQVRQRAQSLGCLCKPTGRRCLPAARATG